jgi:hypothetical protein
VIDEPSMRRVSGGQGSAIRKTAEWRAEFQRRARRMLVRCDDGHQRIVIERFYYLPDDLDDWHWFWDRDLTAPTVTTLIFSDGEDGLWLPPREVVRPGLRRASQIRLDCPRCRRSAIRSWAPWADALDSLANQGLWEITLADLERYAVGRRGSRR